MIWTILVYAVNSKNNHKKIGFIGRNHTSFPWLFELYFNTWHTSGGPISRNVAIMYIQYHNNNYEIVEKGHWFFLKEKPGDERHVPSDSVLAAKHSPIWDSKNSGIPFLKII